MNTEISIDVNFSELGGPVYTGRQKGIAARTKLNLDSANLEDLENLRIRVMIPDDTFSVSSSFFLGLFGDTFRSLGSKERIHSVFLMNTPPRFAKTLESCIDRALAENQPLID